MFSEFCLGLLKKCQQKRRNIENEVANFVDFPAINHTCSEIEGQPNHDRPHVINEPCLSSHLLNESNGDNDSDVSTDSMEPLLGEDITNN